MKKYNICAVLIIKDENEYLQEWVRHHLSIGIEHFYIYDNNSKIPIKETIQKKLKYDERQTITLTDWSGKHVHAQEEAYQHYLNNFGHETHWATFIDTDEFIVINNGETLPELLDHYKGYGGLYVNWKVFNADGQERKENKPVMERFKKSIVDKDNLGKLFVQIECVNFMKIHEAEYKANVPDGIKPITVNENFEYVVGKNSITSTNIIQCNHYITRSWEEWKFKIIQRGVPDPFFGRTLKDFFLYNPDMKYLDAGINRRQEYEPIR